MMKIIAYLPEKAALKKERALIRNLSKGGQRLYNGNLLYRPTEDWEIFNGPLSKKEIKKHLRQAQRAKEAKYTPA